MLGGVYDSWENNDVRGARNVFTSHQGVLQKQLRSAGVLQRNAISVWRPYNLDFKHLALHHQ